ncbi:MAG: asparagine synthase [Algoriphagus sp.]|uniref:asparagine synthetase B family protein n=1 Tax=Algoriphagus sp. TaxID=1872435 RepID=UPI0018439692|nr:asparagine synthase-related protein [Algoriphagus sp.]NVJ87809.1 asparagine synthase [Algoriphagus sp.]
MKGFLGIVKLKDVSLEETKARFLQNFSELKDALEEDGNDFFIASLHPDFPPISLPQFPNFIFSGWCRLDNLEELRKQLGLGSDVEEEKVILNGFHNWGKDLPKHLIGDFSFAIWDKEQKSLFLCKDQLGVRPLFYLEREGFFYFATSIPLIKKAVGKKLPLNEFFIANELKNYPPKMEMTFFKDIRRLKPAHYLELFKEKGFKESRYWELRPIDLSFCKRDEDYIELLRKTLIEAVKSRIRGKNKIGAQLSGGLDSSAITVILSRMINKKDLHTYSFVLDEFTKGFSELKIDEQETQNEIIQYAGLIRKNHHSITRFHFRNVFEELEKRNEMMGGLIPNDAVWQDSLFKEASEKDGIEVMFSGFPGDEGVSDTGSFFFMDYIYEREYLNLLQYILEFRRGGIRKIRNYFRSKKAKTFVPDYYKTQALRNLLNPKFESCFDLKDESFKFSPNYKGWIKHRICMPDTTFRIESETIYANSYGVEMAYPLADIRLLEILISLPSHLFKPKPFNRSVFRKICEGILPDKVRLQKKYNGAFTLAFYEYLCEKNHQEFQGYNVKNHLNLIISEEELLRRESECSYCQKERMNYRKEVDYLIDLNWPPDES